MTVEEFLAGSVFRYGVFPAVSAVVGIFLRCATRPDKETFFKKEDIAVGPQLMLTSIMTYVLIITDKTRYTTQLNKQLLVLYENDTFKQSNGNLLVEEIQRNNEVVLKSPLTLLILVIALAFITLFIKRKGWKDELTLNPIAGIGVPLTFGVLSLMLVTAVAS